MLFHAPLGCPGDYVGVDVFFVISGYLITSLMLRDFYAGRFSLVDFWERRARRILPALSVMVIGTLLAGWWLFFPDDCVALGKSAIAQALLAANFYFWRYDSTADYFNPVSEDRPLLHTWSLAVEEQFYLFFPVLLLFLFRFERFRRQKFLLGLMLLGSAVSLALAAYGVHHEKKYAFYLLPTRAWELLFGALIATFPAGWTPRNRVVRESASWVGLLALLFPCWLYSKETPFPGLAALPPCLGAVLIIWSNGRREGTSLTSVGSLLAWRPVVFVGLISYSLYLWHWPVLVFGKYVFYPESPWHLRAGLLLVTGVLAVLSWRFVETPFRKKTIAASRSAIFRFAGIVTLVSLLAGIGFVAFEGMSNRFGESVLRNHEAKRDKNNAGVARKVKIENVRKDRPVLLGDESSGASPRILLWGDSHARHAIPAMDDFCRESEICGAAVIYGATPPLLNFVPKGGLREKTPEFSAEVVNYIKRHSVSHVVLAARWSSYQSWNSVFLETDLSETIETLASLGCTVWVLQDVPDLDVDVPKVLALQARFDRRDVSWYRTVDEHYHKNEVLYRLAQRNLPAVFLDPAPLFLASDKKSYRPDLDGVSIYYDDDHLTTRASRTLLLPLFREKMADSLSR